jgi:hypothetical protein
MQFASNEGLSGQILAEVFHKGSAYYLVADTWLAALIGCGKR